MDRIGSAPGRTQAKDLEHARSVVRRVVAMFLSHYPNMERAPLRGGWALGYADAEHDEIEAGSAEFADAVAVTAMKDLGLQE